MERIGESINRYLLYIVTAYVLVDYCLRMSRVSFMAGLWDEILFLLIVVNWMVLIGVKGIRPRAGGILIPLMIFYAVVFFVFLIRSPELDVALMELRALVQYTFWFFVALNLVADRQQVKNICDVFLAVGLIVAVYGIYQYIIGVEIPSTWIDKAEVGIRTRVFSFIGSPNVLGSFLILHISIAFASFMAAGHWLKKRLYLGVACISCLCLIFTFSRGAWLVFFFAFILLGIWLEKKILLVLLIAALLVPAAVPSVYDRVSYMLSPQYLESSSEGGRIARWSQALEYWEGSPLTGLGLGRFGGGVAIASFPGSAYSVDNFYLKLGTETGIIGLAAFLYLILAVLREGKKAVGLVDDRYLKILGTGIFVGLIAVLGHNMVENMFEFPLIATHFWFFLGVLVSMPLVQQDFSEVKEHEQN